MSHRDHSRLSLEVPKGLPAILGTPELSPNDWDGGPAFSSRQRLDQVSCRHRGEKTFDLLLVLFNRLKRGLKLNHKRRQKSRFGSHHVLGNCQLRLVVVSPKAR